jgi:hypothetical protein
MLFDHTVTVAQVFVCEGDFDETKRQEVLTKTRAIVKQRLGAIQASVIEELLKQGIEAEGKVRCFVKAERYDPPTDAEFTVQVNEPEQV